MALSNDIVLRPRFKIDYKIDNSVLLSQFDTAKADQSDFIITRIDDHVFIRFPKKEQHYWSPQLHLEIINTETESCTLHGLFGPNPTVWTLFMFLHFVVATLFVAFGIWAYTNWSLDKDYTLQVFTVLLTLVLWFTLYFIGRIGKSKGKPEMHRLHQFMDTQIKKALNEIV